MDKFLFWSRVVGSLAIGLSGVLTSLGAHEWAQITMMLGVAAAAPTKE